MKENIKKFLFPVLLAIVGLLVIITTFTSNQNNLFLLGGIAVLLIAIFSILYIQEIIGKTFLTVINLAMLAIWIFLAVLDYKSIKDPMTFQDEKDSRYEQVKQRLKDIRTVQLAYKTVKGEYANNFDSLLHFVYNDSFPLVKAIGMVPDTLTEMQALDLGLVKRDTSFVLVKDSIFSKHFLKDKKYPFYIDSLPYVPYGGGTKFELQAGEIELGKVKVQVFQVTDTKPFDPGQVLSLGSMTQASTSGNWGE